MPISADFCRVLEVLMGKGSQRKGADGERELAGILAGYGYPVQRGDSQNYGTQPDLIGLPNIHCEVKRTQQLRLHDALEQAKRDSVKFHDGLPTVFFRRNREKWQVCMYLDDWLKLYGGLNE
jgi:Holliday junction resolvase